MRLAVQLYTLRNLDESLPETIARVGDTHYEGVQFVGLGGATPDGLASDLETRLDPGEASAVADSQNGTLVTESDA